MTGRQRNPARERKNGFQGDDDPGLVNALLTQGGIEHWITLSCTRTD